MQSLATGDVRQRIRTTEVHAHIGQRVYLKGWLHTLRRLGGVNFIVLRDGWGLMQAVTENEADLAPLTTEELGAETVIGLEGTVIEYRFDTDDGVIFGSRNDASIKPAILSE